MEILTTHIGAIVAFVKGGPFAKPNPEHTFAHLTQQRVLDGVTTNVVAAEWDYTRRSQVVEREIYPANGTTGIRGQMENVMVRVEFQKRGPKHKHFNEFPVLCGRLPELLQIPMNKE